MADFGKVVQIQAERNEDISRKVRDNLKAENNEIHFKLVACQSDTAAGPLATPLSTLASEEGLQERHLSFIFPSTTNRANEESIALKVLEDTHNDKRFKGKPTCITGYAESVDITEKKIIDQKGNRWKPSSLVDEYRITNRGWLRTISVGPSKANETTAGKVALGLRSVAAATYSIEPHGDSLPSLAVLLAQITPAAVSALQLIGSPGAGPFVGGPAYLELPCGSDILIRAYKDDEGQNVGTVDITYCSSKRSRLSLLAITIMRIVLCGAGIHGKTQTEEDLDDCASLDDEIAGIFWMQAAVTCKLRQSVDQHIYGSFPVHYLVRVLTICGLAARNSSQGDQLETDRILLAKDEATKLVECIDGLELSDLLETLPFQTEDSSRPAVPNSDRDEFLHDGADRSDLPVLENDFQSPVGLQICARRGIPIKPDTRRSVVIRKAKALWGRVTFENSCFQFRPLVDPKAILQAIVPVRRVGAAGFQVEQFEVSMNSSSPGNEIANILLSGVYGADPALWALKKILYSGLGLKPGYLPPYLLPMKDKVDENGFAIVSVLGQKAVMSMEVVVDDQGRIILDYEGDFAPMVVTGRGRRIKLEELDAKEYSGGRVGTISTSACM